MKINALVTASVVLSLVGCAAGPLTNTGTFLPPVHYQTLESAKLCCSSYGDLPYAKLQPGTEVAAAITTESPVFQFEHQRAFFAAFELPTEAKRLVLKTYPVNMLWNRAGHVLVPTVQFLDAQYKPVSTLRPSYLAKNPQFMGRSWGEAEVSVPVAARFVVMFEAIGMPGLAWRDRDQPSGSLSVRSGPTGELSILVSSI